VERFFFLWKSKKTLFDKLRWTTVDCSQKKKVRSASQDSIQIDSWTNNWVERNRCSLKLNIFRQSTKSSLNTMKQLLKYHRRYLFSDYILKLSCPISQNCMKLKKLKAELTFTTNSFWFLAIENIISKNVVWCS